MSEHDPTLQYFRDLLLTRNMDQERARLGYEPGPERSRPRRGRFRRAWNYFAHGMSEPPYRPDRPRFMSRAWWREEWETFVFTYALDRIRAPWRLTWREWVAHAKLFAMNVAAGAAFLGVVYLIVAMIFGTFAGFKVTSMLGLCWIGGWIVGDYRKARAPWPKVNHGDAPARAGEAPRSHGGTFPRTTLPAKRGIAPPT